MSTPHVILILSLSSVWNSALISSLWKSPPTNVAPPSSGFLTREAESEEEEGEEETGPSRE